MLIFLWSHLIVLYVSTFDWVFSVFGVCTKYQLPLSLRVPTNQTNQFFFLSWSLQSPSLSLSYSLSPLSVDRGLHFPPLSFYLSPVFLSPHLSFHPLAFHHHPPLNPRPNLTLPSFIPQSSPSISRSHMKLLILWRKIGFWPKVELFTGNIAHPFPLCSCWCL